MSARPTQLTELMEKKREKLEKDGEKLTELSGKDRMMEMFSLQFDLKVWNLVLITFSRYL